MLIGGLLSVPLSVPSLRQTQAVSLYGGSLYIQNLYNRAVPGLSSVFSNSDCQFRNCVNWCPNLAQRSSYRGLKPQDPY